LPIDGTRGKRVNLPQAPQSGAGSLVHRCRRGIRPALAGHAAIILKYDPVNLTTYRCTRA